MAAALIDQWNVTQDAGFQRRVQMAVLQEVAAVCQEDPATANHANRLAFAQKVVHELDGYSSMAIQQLAALGLDNTTDDATLIGTAAQLVNAFASVA